MIGSRKAPIGLVNQQHYSLRGIRSARSVCRARLGWHAACCRHPLPVSLKQGACTIQTQTLEATQRQRGAGQPAGSGGTTSPCGYSAGGAGGDTKLRCGGMKTYTHQGALPDSQYGRGGGFYQVRLYVVVLCQLLLVCSLAIRVIYHPRVSPAGTAVLHLVPKIRVLHHNNTTAVPYVLLLLYISTRAYE